MKKIDTTTKMAQVGDVIMSPDFAKGQADSQGRVSVGWNYGADNDQSRADAKYVVEKVAMDGGGTGMGPHDIYPNGWHVHARRLQDGKYDPEGEPIEFYQSGAFSCLIPEVRLVGHMQRKVTCR